MRGPLLGRAAKRFAHSVDAPTRHGASRGDTNTRELVGITHQLQSVQFDVAPTDDFRSQLRQRLIAVATVQGIGETQPSKETQPKAEPTGTLGDLLVPRPRSPLTERISETRQRAHRRVAFAAGALTTLVLVGGLAVAESGHALPGDALYGLKRTTESVQLSLSGSDVSTGREHLNLASTRLSEVTKLIGRGDTAAGSFRYVAGGGGLTAHQRALVTSTLDDMDRQTTQGTRLLTTAAVRSGNTAPLNDLRSWAGKQSRAMHGLQQRVGKPTSDRVGASVSVLDHVVSRVGGLLNGPDCACPAGSDSLGPLPCSTCPAPKTPHVPSSAAAEPTGPASTTPGSSSSSSTGPSTSSTSSRSTSPRRSGSSSSTSPSGQPSTSPSQSPSSLPSAPSSSSSPTPTGVLPSGILPTDGVPSHSLLPSWLLPSLIPPNLLPFGN
ncbi:MAG TPA: DUF5667 domain-containing protein [Mycobacteriales bacterium]|jgi:hypothetical protein|nr:DUF5667 domain-containing protein [Mycobacteriales bacterium]